MMAGVMCAVSAVVSANEATRRFGASDKAARRWIRSGRLKADKHGRADCVDLSEVAALIGADIAHDNGHPADSAQVADTDSAPDTADPRPVMSAMSGLDELVVLVDRFKAEARQHAAVAESPLLALAAAASSASPVAGPATVFAAKTALGAAHVVRGLLAIWARPSPPGCYSW
jgi:hypothetical protein